MATSTAALARFSSSSMAFRPACSVCNCSDTVSSCRDRSLTVNSSDSFFLRDSSMVASAASQARLNSSSVAFRSSRSFCNCSETVFNSCDRSARFCSRALLVRRASSMVVSAVLLVRFNSSSMAFRSARSVSNRSETISSSRERSVRTCSSVSPLRRDSSMAFLAATAASTAILARFSSSWAAFRSLCSVRYCSEMVSSSREHSARFCSRASLVRRAS